MKSTQSKAKKMTGYKNVLVIGGSGFVGTNLCESLLNKKISVTSYDNYFTGSQRNHLSGVDYIRGEASNINEYDFRSKFSHVFHLGEYSRVEQSFDDIDKVFEYNYHSIYEVLKFVRNSKAKLIYSGSSTKFGDDGETVFESPYAYTKKANVDLVKVYSNWFDLEYAIAYFYNVYGDKEISEGKYATLIGKYTNLIENGSKELPVVSPGDQRRNFTDIRDIVSALEIIGLKGSGDGYGIGAEESYSILEIVDLFGSKPTFLPERRGNRMSAPIITDKTKRLGWEQKYKLEEFIQKIIIKSEM